MEEKQKRKISLISVIIIILILILIIYAGIFIYNNFFRENYETYRNGHSTTVISDSKSTPRGKNVNYTTKSGYCYETSECNKNTFVRSFKEFEKYINTFGEVKSDGQNVLEIFDKNFFVNNSLAVEAHKASYDNYKTNSITLQGSKVNINISIKKSWGSAFLPYNTEFTFYIFDKNVKSAKFNMSIKESNYGGFAFKPIIYLYPTEDMNVSVKLGYKENITISYPKYINGWNVFAKKDGTLTDLSTNRNLYALYYENKNIIPFNEQDDGFVVKGEDSAKFLEEKLAILGLTEREAEEFIIYWLPQLENNKYNYIRFATNEEINKNMPLEINPRPDTIIRVLMTFKGLEEPITVKEQKLYAHERNGFTVVEWGGTEIK